MKKIQASYIVYNLTVIFASHRFSDNIKKRFLCEAGLKMLIQLSVSLQIMIFCSFIVIGSM